MVAQMVKRLPVMRETLIQSLGRKDPLEEEMATHSSTLAWKIPWMEEAGSLQSMGSEELDTTERLHLPYLVFQTLTSCKYSLHCYTWILIQSLVCSVNVLSV